MPEKLNWGRWFPWPVHPKPRQLNSSPWSRWVRRGRRRSASPGRNDSESNDHDTAFHINYSWVFIQFSSWWSSSRGAEGISTDCKSSPRWVLGCMGGWLVLKHIIALPNEVSSASNLFRGYEQAAKVVPHEGGKTVRPAQQTIIIAPSTLSYKASGCNRNVFLQ
jgi:hypothetical protein